MDSEPSDSASGTSAPPLFVTGAAGHVGANLVRRLLDDGARVRVLLRHGDNNEAMDGLDVERVYGDIRDLDATRQALAGCYGVFHTAALVSTIEGDDAHRRDVFETNVIGTRHVLQAAQEFDAGRVVVTGSFSAVGYDLDDPSAPSRESMPFFPMERTMPYERSKAMVETECWHAAANGQDVVIATSCAVVGGNDFMPSRMGRTLVDFANGKLRAYVDGGFEFVAAQDIVQGHVLSMERGRTGQKYIFSSEYLTISNILDLFQEVSGIRRPQRQIPVGLMLPMSVVVSNVSVGCAQTIHSDSPLARSDSCRNAVTPTPASRKRNWAFSQQRCAPQFAMHTRSTISARPSPIRARSAPNRSSRKVSRHDQSSDRRNF